MTKTRTMLTLEISEAEAIEALEDSFAHDFWNCSDILAFATREAAEECLAQNDD